MAARLLRLWVRIPLGAWTFVCCDCCVLSGRGLCNKLITRPEESYRLWRVVVYDLETSKEEAKNPLKGCEYKRTMGCGAEKGREGLQNFFLHCLQKFLKRTLPISNSKTTGNLRFYCGGYRRFRKICRFHFQGESTSEQKRHITKALSHL